jgi:hypothetical protein
MNSRLLFCLVIASFAVAGPRSAAADASIQAVFDTVDSVEIVDHEPCSGCASHALVIVKGILTGASAPTSRTFDFSLNVASATRCEHLAVIAMSKPGKYQLGIGAQADSAGGHGDCKLILVTP